jgi:hypothetical protein
MILSQIIGNVKLFFLLTEGLKSTQTGKSERSEDPNAHTHTHTHTYNLMCFERHVSEVLLSQQSIRKFVGNRLAEEYAYGKQI